MLTGWTGGLHTEYIRACIRMCVCAPCWLEAIERKRHGVRLLYVLSLCVEQWCGQGYRYSGVQQLYVTVTGTYRTFYASVCVRVLSYTNICV